MSSFNKKIQKKRYAEDRRQLQRNELEKNLRADAEQELRQYFDEQKFSNDELIQAYPAIYEFIKRKAPNLGLEKICS
jgi:DNA/RNA-binding domain of Phe-tRNA-synthetase-like protein